MFYDLTRPLRLGLLLAFVGTLCAQSPWLTAYGDAGCGSDFVPTWHTAGEMPVIGNAGFRLVSENLIGQAPGLVLLSGASANLPFLGMTVYVHPALLFSLCCQATGTRGIPGAGTSSLPLPIPPSVALVGGRLYLQGFFLDTTVASGWVHTQGLGITIAQSITAPRAWIRDRLKYQALFTGVNQAQADTYGRVIWAGNHVAGYSYVKTEKFICGGESHWMVILLHPQTGMEFCLIPGGSFRMGDINSTGHSAELPVHWVHIKPFLLARTEVPQSVWQAVMGSNPSYFRGATMPVEWVDWNEAQSFCARTGLRLPSEAEWEYACRAGVDNCYHFGENCVAADATAGSANLGLYAWYLDNSGGRTNPVAGKLPNAFGLYDMYGNVLEWCEDRAPSANDYKCAPSDGGARLGGLPFRAHRGANWFSHNWFCRSSNRGWYDPGDRRQTLGFRPSGPSLP